VRLLSTLRLLKSPSLTVFTDRYTAQNIVKITRYRRRTCVPRSSLCVCTEQVLHGIYPSPPSRFEFTSSFSFACAEVWAFPPLLPAPSVHHLGNQAARRGRGSMRYLGISAGDMRGGYPAKAPNCSSQCPFPAIASRGVAHAFEFPALSAALNVSSLTRTSV
jgi:hypothetical protein